MMKIFILCDFAKFFVFSFIKMSFYILVKFFIINCPVIVWLALSVKLWSGDVEFSLKMKSKACRDFKEIEK